MSFQKTWAKNIQTNFYPKPAVEMATFALEEGFDSLSLRLLAGENPDYLDTETMDSLLEQIAEDFDLYPPKGAGPGANYVPNNRLAEYIKNIYKAFNGYKYSGRKFCGFCYYEEEIERITSTSIQAIGIEDARRLLFESADHWESAEVYKHYLPRILEILGPPVYMEEMIPGHLMRTLGEFRFNEWLPEEKVAVSAYLKALKPAFTFLDVGGFHE